MRRHRAHSPTHSPKHSSAKLGTPARRVSRCAGRRLRSVRPAPVFELTLPLACPAQQPARHLDGPCSGARCAAGASGFRRNLRRTLRRALSARWHKTEANVSQEQERSVARNLSLSWRRAGGFPSRWSAAGLPPAHRRLTAASLPPAAGRLSAAQAPARAHLDFKFLSAGRGLPGSPAAATRAARVRGLEGRRTRREGRAGTVRAASGRGVCARMLTHWRREHRHEHRRRQGHESPRTAGGLREALRCLGCRRAPCSPLERIGFSAPERPPPWPCTDPH